MRLAQSMSHNPIISMLSKVYKVHVIALSPLNAIAMLDLSRFQIESAERDDLQQGKVFPSVVTKQLLTMMEAGLLSALDTDQLRGPDIS